MNAIGRALLTLVLTGMILVVAMITFDQTMCCSSSWLAFGHWFGSTSFIITFGFILAFATLIGGLWRLP